MHTKSKRIGPHKTRVITDVSQVPEGFVSINEYEGSRQFLSHLHVDGRIRAVKIMRTPDDIRGPVFVSKQDADNAIRAKSDNAAVVPFAPSEENMSIRRLRNHVLETHDVVVEIDAKLDRLLRELGCKPCAEVIGGEK